MISVSVTTGRDRSAGRQVQVRRSQVCQYFIISCSDENHSTPTSPVCVKMLYVPHSKQNSEDCCRDVHLNSTHSTMREISNKTDGENISVCLNIYINPRWTSMTVELAHVVLSRLSFTAISTSVFLSIHVCLFDMFVVFFFCLRLPGIFMYGSCC